MNNPDIIANYQNTLRLVTQTAKRVNREPETIKLCAVSKQQPNSRISVLLQAGHKVFGENRVQEAKARWEGKFSDFRSKIELRLIGPLQTNKAIAACELFDVIETLDREKLARALVKAIDRTGKTPRFFVQVNIGEEPQKSGVLPHDLDEFIKTLRKVYKIEPEGLMCIPPIGSKISGHAPAPYFALLAKLAKRNGIKKLSMGMSADFETAICFGATNIRVGSGIFGARL